MEMEKKNELKVTLRAELTDLMPLTGVPARLDVFAFHRQLRHNIFPAAYNRAVASVGRDKSLTVKMMGVHLSTGVRSIKVDDMHCTMLSIVLSIEENTVPFQEALALELEKGLRALDPAWASWGVIQKAN